MHLASTPFEALLSLEKEILLSAKGLPLPPSNKDNWMGLSFLAGIYVILTPLDEVVEIIPFVNLEKVPGVKRWLRGMVTSHGKLFPVTDLNGFIHGKNALITHYSRIIVVNFQDDFAGFLVDRVLGLQRIAKEFLQKTQSHEDTQFSPFLVAGFTNKHIELPIISFKAIMQHPRFRDVAIKEDNIEDEY